MLYEESPDTLVLRRGEYRRMQLFPESAYNQCYRQQLCFVE